MPNPLISPEARILAGPDLNNRLEAAVPSPTKLARQAAINALRSGKRLWDSTPQMTARKRGDVIPRAYEEIAKMAPGVDKWIQANVLARNSRLPMSGARVRPDIAELFRGAKSTGSHPVTAKTAPLYLKK